MDENQKQCKNCVYYDGAEKAGKCRLNPPRVIAMPKSDEDVFQSPKTNWPEVNSTDWCGKLEPK